MILYKIGQIISFPLFFLQEKVKDGKQECKV